MKTSHHDKFYAKCDSVDLYNHVRKVMNAGHNSQNKRPTDGPSARVAVQGQPESDSATALMAEQIQVLQSEVNQLNRQWGVASDDGSDAGDGR